MEVNRSKESFLKSEKQPPIFDSLTGDLYFLIAKMNQGEKLEMVNFAKSLLDRIKG